MTPATQELLDFADEYIEQAGGTARAGMCWTASWNVRDEFGLDLVEGEFNGTPHTWNVLPGGTIFDATHGQFDGGPPRFFPANTPGFTPKDA